MSILGALSISTQGMKSQATALGVIGTNVANVRSGGYKRSDPFFKTLQSEATFEQSDINANRPVISQRISQQGTLRGTNSDLDLAIIGDGLFITRTTFDTSGDILYTRDGSFAQSSVNDISVTDIVSGTTVSTKDAYLVDKNGNFLLGYAANADGTFPTSGIPAPMRVDPYAYVDTGRPTTAIDLAFNLNSNTPALDPDDPTIYDHLSAIDSLETTGIRPAGMDVSTIDFIDSNGERQSARINFTKGSENQWDMSLTYQDLPIAQIDTVSIGGAIEAGDSYSIAIDGITVSHTAIGGDTTETVVNALLTKLANSNPVSMIVTATAGATPGTIDLTAVNPGNPFTTTPTALDGGGTPDNTSSVTTPTANFTGLTTTTPTTIVFEDGKVSTPTAPLSFSIAYPPSEPGGASSTAAFTMDVSGFSQYAVDFHQQRYSENGYEASAISRIGFDEVGHVVGFFATGNSVSLYQVPLANFINPNGLESTNGMTFRETAESGTPDIQLVTESGKAIFSPHTHEISNVSLADEFTAMIKTQKAYSSSAKAFQTVNEMLQLVKDMKR